jgi:putative transposase
MVDWFLGRCAVPCLDCGRDRLILRMPAQAWACHRACMAPDMPPRRRLSGHDSCDTLLPMPSPHRKTCRRYDIPGDAHGLTFSCYQRLPLFSRERSCMWMLEVLELGRTRQQYDLWAYVIMPEHVHIILWPRLEVRIASILTTLKQSVAKRALLWLQREAPAFLTRLEDRQPNGRRCYRFWQRGGGYDRNLRTIADIYRNIEYVHANPVRRELVSAPEDWQWSSYRAWQTGEDRPIAVDRASLPSLIEGLPGP